MNCKELDALLDSAPLGSLREAQLEQVREHLNHCAECRFKHRVLEDCRTLDEDGEVPAAFSQALRQRIKQEEVPPVKQLPQLKKWLAIAAALVVLAGGTWLAGQTRRQMAYSRDSAINYGTYANPTLTQSRSAEGDFAASAPMADYAPMESQAETAKQAEKIIRTARLELSTREFDKDHQAILDALNRAGGRVQSSNLYNSMGSLRALYLTIRVPSQNLDSFAESLQGVGKLVSYSQSAEDVSEQYFDTANRLKTQRTKMERLQALLAKAENVEDLITIENSISETQYEMDRLQGQLSGMDSKVNEATLTLTLNELSPIDTSKDQDESLFQRITSGMAAAFAGFTAILSDLVVFLSVALPYLLGLLILVLIIRALIKRRKKP